MIIDLHSDLLSYLAQDPSHTIYDSASRASVEQLKKGGVRIQTLAVYSKTSASSVRSGLSQTRKYIELLQHHDRYFTSYWDTTRSSSFKTLLSFENASAFCSEKESFEGGIRRLRRIVDSCEKPFSVSLTWKEENRFGGGDTTKIGLKDDGKRLIYELQDLTYAIDLSHASDTLACDILSFCEKERLNTRFIASHSNMRSIHYHDRNLPDEIASEIAARGGLIGLNLIVQFLGTSPDAFLKHVDWGLQLGFGKSLCLGADFFSDSILAPEKKRAKEPHFFEGFDNASCYNKLYQMIETTFGATVAASIACDNAIRFISSLPSCQSTK